MSGAFTKCKMCTRVVHTPEGNWPNVPRIVSFSLEGPFFAFRNDHGLSTNHWNETFVSGRFGKIIFDNVQGKVGIGNDNDARDRQKNGQVKGDNFAV